MTIAPPSSITYSPSSLTLVKGVAMTTVTPTTSGGRCPLVNLPSLPSGLSFSTSTGAISGTPTAVSSSTSYTVTATNSGGSGTATVTIHQRHRSFRHLQPKHADVDQEHRQDHGHADVEWRGGHLLSIPPPSRPVFPSQPRPVPSPNTNGGHFRHDVYRHGQQHRRQQPQPSPSLCTTRPVLHRIQPEFTHVDQGFSHDHGHANIQRWCGEFVVDLPIASVRLVLQYLDRCHQRYTNGGFLLNLYTVTATNLGGSGTATVTIQVNDVSPYSIVYNGNPFTLTKGTAMTTVTPSVSGGTVTSWSISPSLPSGLVFSTSNGAISGTPTTITSSTTYTVTASNTRQFHGER